MTYDEFVHAGAKLSPPDKERLKKLNSEESTLSDAFIKKLLAANTAGAYTTAAPDALAGFSEAQLAAAALAAQGPHASRDTSCRCRTRPSSRCSARSACARRGARSSTVPGIAPSTGTRTTPAPRSSRARAAARAARGTSRVSQSRRLAAQGPDGEDAGERARLHERSRASRHGAAAREGKDIQAVIDAQHGGFTLEAVGLGFLRRAGAQGEVRSQRCGDQAVLRARTTCSRTACSMRRNQLYGITFKERKDIPVYQPEVRVFDVIDADGKPLALFYCDYFKRDNKNGGAWMSNFVGQSKLLGTGRSSTTSPTCRSPLPASRRSSASRTSSRCSTSSATLCTGCSPTRSIRASRGPPRARDFVEFPSQFNEHWAMYPAVFDHYARHYKTGAVMPRGAGREDQARRRTSTRATR